MKSGFTLLINFGADGSVPPVSVELSAEEARLAEKKAAAANLPLARWLEREMSRSIQAQLGERLKNPPVTGVAGLPPLRVNLALLSGIGLLGDLPESAPPSRDSPLPADD